MIVTSIFCAFTNAWFDSQCSLYSSWYRTYCSYIHELLEKQAWYVASNYCLDETQEKMAHTEQLEIESAFE